MINNRSDIKGIRAGLRGIAININMDNEQKYIEDLITKGKSYHVMVAMVINEFNMEYDDAWMLVNDALPETESNRVIG